MKKGGWISIADNDYQVNLASWSQSVSQGLQEGVLNLPEKFPLDAKFNAFTKALKLDHVKG